MSTPRPARLGFRRPSVRTRYGRPLIRCQSYGLTEAARHGRARRRRRVAACRPRSSRSSGEPYSLLPIACICPSVSRLDVHCKSAERLDVQRKLVNVPMATEPESSSQPRVPLSRERVLSAAIGLADQGGIQSLTMRKLAQRRQKKGAHGGNMVSPMEGERREAGEWGREDSNLRRLSRRVYSPFPLAARAHPREDAPL